MSMSGATHVFYVVAMNEDTECQAPDSVAHVVVLTVNPSPEAPSLDADFNPGALLCEGDVVILTAGTVTGMPATYTWYLDGEVILGETTDTYVTTVSGTYTVLATNSNGCVSDMSLPLTITIHSLPEKPEITPDPAILCEGNLTELRATPGASTYVWYRNGEPMNGSDYYYQGEYPDPAGTWSYTVMAVSESGCSSTLSDVNEVTVLEPPAVPIIEQTPNGQQVMKGIEVRLVITNDNEQTSEVSYQWYRNTTLLSNTQSRLLLPSVDFEHEGTYTVVASKYVTVGEACTARATLVLSIGDIEITIPNVLTPNGDTWNDSFDIEGIEWDWYDSTELIVVNRWGNEVYRKKGYNGREGGFTGEGLQDGTYFYYLRLVKGDRSNTYKGFITLKK
jgi:gliding motility-associated-like protein